MSTVGWLCSNFFLVWLQHRRIWFKHSYSLKWVQLDWWHASSHEIGGGGLYRNQPVCLSVRLSVQSKLNLGHNFLTKGDRALILHKCIPCDKTFPSIPKFLTSWPWTWLLTYFWKNLTLAITFEPKEIGLSYFTFVFVLARPFCWNQFFFTSWPWPWLLTYFWKKLTLTITYEPKVIGL